MSKIRVIVILSILIFPLISLGQNTYGDLLDKAYDALDDNRPNEAIEFTHEAFDWAAVRGDTYKMVIAKSTMGYIGMELRDYESSYLNYTDALKYLNKADTVDLFNKVAILRNLAMIKSKYSDYQMATTLYKEAYETAKLYVRRHREYAEANGDLSYLIDLPYFMAMQMKNSGDYTGAGEVLLDLWEVSEFKGDTVSLARALNQLGIIKLTNKEYLEAQNFFSFVAFNDAIAPDTRAIALQNLGVAYMELGNLEKAEQWYTAALAMKEEHSSARSQFVTLLDIGELEFKKGNAEAAISRWESALSRFNKIDAEPDLFIVYDWLQKAYLHLDVVKAEHFGNLYSVNIQGWMGVQKNQMDNPTLQAFNTRVDQVLRNREEKAEQLAMIKEFWPIGLAVVFLLTFILYHLQLFIVKKRRRYLKGQVKEVRVMRAQEILNKVRRDL